MKPSLNDMPVVGRLEDFDQRSGSWLERLVFNHRLVLLALCALVTLLLVGQAAKLVINASFDRLIPQSHPYIQNYLQHKDDLRGIGNTVRVVVENLDGDIYDPRYLDVLHKVNEALFLTPGVDRPYVKSLWMPAVRWVEVTERGFEGGPVMPPTFSGQPAEIAALRTNVTRAGIIGSLVANDLKSSMIEVPLLELDAMIGQRLDYGAFGRTLEQSLDALQEQAARDGVPVRIHVIGFAKLAGDLINGMGEVAAYFLFAGLMAALIIYCYTRCMRSTLLTLACSLVAVIWQLGLVRLLGFELDPYSVLVPFLVFAIGVSHGAQKMNGIMQDIGRGTHRYVAARYTFRRLFFAGLTALIADAVGFAVLVVIDIPVIQGLALAASIGVAVLVFTNLLLLPVLLSYVGVGRNAAARSLAADDPARTGRGFDALWCRLERLTEPRFAVPVLLVAGAVTVAGFLVSLKLQVGDLDPGAPELRADSDYNRSSTFINEHFGLSSDQFVVIVKGREDPAICEDYRSLVELDRLELALRQTPGVQRTASLASATRAMSAGLNEGYAKWAVIPDDARMLNTLGHRSRVSFTELMNSDCTVVPVIAYLSDHKAETLTRVLGVVEQFAAEHSDADLQFLPLAGSAGIDAVTNIVVHKANRTMLLLIYAAVILLCLVTFRSWRATLVAVVPLVITSVLCEALMVALGMGVKVATLPVVALGVGIGVDYALYLLSVQLTLQRQGMPLRQAYREAGRFTGKVVALVGVTLAAGVITWVLSPLKFQADMGILLTFMFLWNMIGALVLIPALSCFLLRSKAERRAGGAYAV